MQYNYKFEKEKCWYSQVCSKYNTMDCNGGCVRYIKFHYLVTNSLLPEKQQRPKKLMVPKKDIGAYKELNNIKNKVTNRKQQIKVLHNYLLCCIIIKN